MVKYAVLPAYQANTTDKVQLKLCYSSFSSVNRPWRAANNVIAVRLLHSLLQLQTPSTSLPSLCLPLSMITYRLSTFVLDDALFYH